jgi:hypothetical protein
MSAKAPVRVWTAPIVLGVLTAVGLISALVSDSAGDVLAWLTVGAPVAVVLWYLPRRQRLPPTSQPTD